MAWHPFRNLPLKAVALALGAALWFSVSGQRVERRLWVPINYSNVPSDLVLTGDQLDTVSVQVRGNDKLIGQLGDANLRVVVDLGEAHPGANIMPLRTDQIEAPLGVEALQVEPGAVTVTLERAGRMDVLVQPTVEGRPASGFEIGAISVEPRMVTVSGPESRLKDSVTLITERILVDGRSGRLVQDVGVGVVDAQLRVVAPMTVKVTVDIVRAEGAR
jgi:YbbR domain-containing protein